MNKSFFLWALVLVVLFGNQPLFGQIIFHAQVQRVVDGDTLVLQVGEVRYRARLHGIDAPERKQSWGEESAEVLRNLVSQAPEILVEVPDIDRYGRLIVRLFLKELEINREMLRLGAAWHYTQFDQSDDYAQAQEEALREMRGLWASEEPLPPWEWRRR